MTDIPESPLASALDDDSPLARLFAMVDGEATADEQRDDAQPAAAHYAYTVHGATVGQVLEDMDRAGQTPVKDNRLRPARSPGWRAVCSCTTPSTSARPPAPATSSRSEVLPLWHWRDGSQLAGGDRVGEIRLGPDRPVHAPRSDVACPVDDE
ncbi:hypothetical protein [Streptomyces sp. NPDC000618]|uniref:hypothetical protein n=1 Tax=Streptomyces sp. NPDC000618 TaxID=3154265 RepID=UPI00332917E8